jgi:Icc-related predicted phosphoesterase
MATLTRIIVASDLRGNEHVWRTFVNAISLDVFKVDAALLAGGWGVDRDRARGWVGLAAERIGDGSIPLYVIPGGADDPAIDGELSSAGGNPVNVDGGCYELPGGRWLVADSCRPGPDALHDRLAVALGQRHANVLMTAAPPYDAVTGGGSSEVTEAIERLGPGLSVHGLAGVTGEPPDPKRWIGDTLALTPGSEADGGTLLGFVVDLVGDGVRLARPFQT